MTTTIPNELKSDFALIVEPLPGCTVPLPFK
jgi:hypothetical protein